jgi:C4-dicarboxylate-specific signal transduction histidine kinase
VAVILDNANRAAEIVRGMLFCVRRTPRKVPPVCLADAVVSEMAALRRTLPADVRVELHTDVAEGWVAIHPGELGQIIRNLVDNAVYSMGGRGTVTIRADEFHVADDPAAHPPIPVGHYGRVSISDHAPGIGPSLSQRIFEPFPVSNDIGKVAGLGLSVVQGIIRSRGAPITARNLPESGAVFEIPLPSIGMPVGVAGNAREFWQRRSDAG